jgi:hypothetical protein
LPACTAACALRRCSRAAWHAPFAPLAVIFSSFTSTSTPSSSSARGRPQRKSERERLFAAAAPAPARCALRGARGAHGMRVANGMRMARVSRASRPLRARQHPARAMPHSCVSCARPSRPGCPSPLPAFSGTSRRLAWSHLRWRSWATYAPATLTKRRRWCLRSICPAGKSTTRG